MLYPRLTNNLVCASIPALLSKIDCRLNVLASDLYNNTIYMLNKPIYSDEISILLNYKRILTMKYCNPTYCEKFTVEMIASRVKLLTLNCVSKCFYEERLTTTTTTIVPIANYISSLTSSNIFGVCMFSRDVAVYTSTPTIQVGTILYTDSNLTTVYSDTTNLYRSGPLVNDSSFTYIKINSSGAVTQYDINPCIT